MSAKHPKQYAENFTKSLHSLMDKGRRRAWDVFSDFCEMAYCALAQKTHTDDQRREWLEDRYMGRANKYTKEQSQTIADMMAMTALAMDGTYDDFLGFIYEKEGFCDQRFGAQFFTPWALSQMTAAMTIGDLKMAKMPPVLTLHEPCCGSGRLVLAAAEHMYHQDVDPAKKLWVDAIDLDIVCSQMAYIQMTFAGIPGIVRHGNTIALTQQDAAITAPGVLLMNDSRYLRDWFNGRKGTALRMIRRTGRQTRRRRRPRKR